MDKVAARIRSRKTWTDLCRPSSLAAAQRIPGVTPAALLLLLQHVRRRGSKQRELHNLRKIADRQPSQRDTTLDARELATA